MTSLVAVLTFLAVALWVIGCIYATYFASKEKTVSLLDGIIVILLWPIFLPLSYLDEG